MATENQSPTNESSGSAIPANSGADLGGALSENDLASYLNENTDSIPKAFEGKRGGEKGKMIPNPFEPRQEETGADKSEVNSDSNSDEEALDLDLLDGDSENTKDETDNDSSDESLVEVTVDGKKFEVKQSELIATYQKQESASSKFRDAEKLHVEASTMRKEADDVKAVYAKERDTLKGLLAQYQNFIESSYREQQPNWEQLLHDDPAEHYRQQQYWLAKQAQLNEAKTHHEQIKKQEDAERKVHAQKYLDTQREQVYKTFPQWQNKEVAQRDAKHIQDYLNSVGFSPEEQDNLSDARMLEVVFKATKYDQLVKANDQKKNKQAPSAKTLNAGAATTNDPGFKSRQAQTQAARDAKAWNDSLRTAPTQKNFEAYLLNQMIKGKK